MHTFTPQCCDLLKRYGYKYRQVEHWRVIRGKPYREDFCGFADLLAFRPPSLSHPGSLFDCTFSFSGVLAIQACSESDISAHLEKATAGTPKEDLIDWLLCGNRFEIWAFPRRNRISKYRIGSTPSGRSRLLNARFLRITYEHFQFFQDDTTELTCFGYDTRSTGRDRQPAQKPGYRRLTRPA